MSNEALAKRRHDMTTGSSNRNPVADQELSLEDLAKVSGGDWKRNGVIPGYKAPTVLLDDGINVRTTGLFTSNVGYDSPFTPIPA
jgi:hypothetical protein